MTDDVEINYDKDGNEKSVVVSYELYCEMLTAKSEFDELRNSLNHLYYVLSELVVQPEPVAPSEIVSEIEEFSSTEAEPDTIDDSSSATELRDIRYYQHARGYYVDSKRFCVLAGSKAKASPSPTFDSINSLADHREWLISNGILVRETEWSDFAFSRDYVFSSPSAAASIVDGNSRSGPQAWGYPRIKQ